MTRLAESLTLAVATLVAAIVLLTPAPAEANGCGWGFTDWRQQVGQGSCSWAQGGYKNANFYFSGQISLPSQVTSIVFSNGTIDDIGEMTANGTMVHHDPSGCVNNGYGPVTLTNPGSVVTMYLHTVDSCGGSTGGTVQFTFYRSTPPPPIQTACEASPNPVRLSGGQATTTLKGIGFDPGSGAISQYSWDFGDGTTAVTDASVTGPPRRAASEHGPAPDTPLLIETAQAGGGVVMPGPPIAISADPSTVYKGESTTLSWSVESDATNTYWIRYTSRDGAVVEKSLTIPIGTSSVYGVESTNLYTLMPYTFTVGAPTIDMVAVVKESAWYGSYSIYKQVYQVPQHTPVTIAYRINDSAFWYSFVPGAVESNFGAQATLFGIGEQSVTPSQLSISSNFYPGTPPKSGSYTFTPTIGSSYYIEATDHTGTNRVYASIGVVPPPATHSYTQAGTYTVRVTASSTSGNTGSGSCTVTVLGPGPTVDLKVNGSDGPVSVERGKTAIFTWTSTDATASPPCLASTEWGGASQPESSTGVTVPILQSGSYQLTCTGDGSATDTVQLTATDPPPGAPTLDPPSLSCLTSSVQARITLRWSESIDPAATSYTIMRSAGTAAFTSVTSQSVSQPRSFTDTVTAVNGASYRYRIDATNGTSAPTESNMQPVVVSCAVADSLGLTVTPPSATVVVGDTQQFRASVTVGGVQQSAGSSLSVQWSVGDQAAGTIEADGDDRALATFTAGQTPGTYSGANGVVATATYTTPSGVTVVIEKQVPITVTDVVGGVSGDVFSGGDVRNIVISDANSVVSATGDIVGLDAHPLKIKGYKPSNSLDWTTAKSSILNQAAKLKREQVTSRRVLKDGGSNASTANNFTLTGSFHLNPPVGDDYRQQTNRENPAAPEGSVWYVPGDLTVKGPVMVYGRGTIIVKGNVTISGTSANYVDSSRGSLGIILEGGGSVTVEPTVTKLVGAYFVPSGSINFSEITPLPTTPTGLTATGLFVGNQIQLARLKANIRYDASAIGQRTPPGFGVVTLPGVQEAAP